MSAVCFFFNFFIFVDCVQNIDINSCKCFSMNFYTNLFHVFILQHMCSVNISRSLNTLLCCLLLTYSKSIMYGHWTSIANNFSYNIKRTFYILLLHDYVIICLCIYMLLLFSIVFFYRCGLPLNVTTFSHIQSLLPDYTILWIMREPEMS